MVCRFSINTTAVGCEVQLFQDNFMALRRVRFNRNFHANIAEGCMLNINTGYYDLYVYDVENDNTLSQLPAIIKNQVFVQQETTSVTMSTISNSTSSIVSSSMPLISIILSSTSLTG